jgi:adenylylsulfate kinase-like enzyme
MCSKSVSPQADTFAPAVLLTGLPSSGKTTLGNLVVAELRRRDRRAHLLDGDELRQRLPPRLGFSRADREAQAGRAGYIASVLRQHHVMPVIALVIPYATSRRDLAAALDGECVEVHLTAPLTTLVARDTRGIYRRTAESGDARYAAVVEPYETPERPTLRLDTNTLGIQPCVDAILRLLCDLTTAGGVPHVRDAG